MKNKSTLLALSAALSLSFLSIQGLAQAKYSSQMTFTIGEDSNIYPDKNKKDGGSGSFFEVSPQLNIESQNWSGNLGAKIKDFAKQEISDKAKHNAFSAEVTYKAKMAELTQSKTSLSLNYSDEMWPDWLDGTDGGMPMRYFKTQISQDLAWDFNRLNLGVNGFFANTDFLSEYTDWAPKILGQQYFQRDNNSFGIEGRVSYKLSKNFEIVGRPKVSQVIYKEEPARQTDGSKGGEASRDGTDELNFITNEFNLDLKSTFGILSVTPTLHVATRADQVHGAEDSSYVGGGLNMSITLDDKSKFKISSNISYKKRDFDNWKSGPGLDDVNTRKDNSTSISLASSFNLTENTGVGLSYTNTRAKSNWAITDVNYRQEVIGTSLTVQF